MINYLLATFFPFVIFIKRNQPIKAALALVLQASGVGWFIASIWALFEVSATNSTKSSRNAGARLRGWLSTICSGITRHKVKCSQHSHQQSCEQVCNAGHT